MPPNHIPRSYLIWIEARVSVSANETVIVRLHCARQASRMTLEVNLQCQAVQRVFVERRSRFLKARVPLRHVLCVVFHKGGPSLPHKGLIGLCVLRSQLAVVEAMAQEQSDKVIITRIGLILMKTSSCETPARCLTQRTAAVDLDSIEVMITPLAGCLPIRQPGPIGPAKSDRPLDRFQLFAGISDEDSFLRHCTVVVSACSRATRLGGIINSRCTAIRCITGKRFSCRVSYLSNKSVAVRGPELLLVRGLVVHSILNSWRIEVATVLLVQFVARERWALLRRRSSRTDPSVLVRLRLRRRSHRRLLDRTDAGAVSISARRRSR